MVKLETYLEINILRTAGEFKQMMLKFNFNSPLNFIMLPEDFKEFFRIFKHGKLLSQYMCNIYFDSLFSLQQEPNSTKK